MILSIADQLKKRIKEKSLTVREVERQADLKMNAVRNIITGAIKQPGARTLKAIADVLGCSVDDLLETKESSVNLDKELARSLPLENFDLFLKTSEIVVHTIRKRGQVITVEQALDLIRGIYSFSSKKKQETIDKDFVEWLFDAITKS